MSYPTEVEIQELNKLKKQGCLDTKKHELKLIHLIYNLVTKSNYYNLSLKKTCPNSYYRSFDYYFYDVGTSKRKMRRLEKKIIQSIFIKDLEKILQALTHRFQKDYKKYKERFPALEEPQKKVCSKCDSLLSEGSFCRICGTKYFPKPNKEKERSILDLKEEIKAITLKFQTLKRQYKLLESEKNKTIEHLGLKCKEYKETIDSKNKKNQVSPYFSNHQQKDHLIEAIVLDSTNWLAPFTTDQLSPLSVEVLDSIYKWIHNSQKQLPILLYTKNNFSFIRHCGYSFSSYS